jgi:hypothetical protein
VNLQGATVVFLAALLLLAASLLPASAQGTVAEFLCQPHWQVGGKATYFATLIIRTTTVGNIIFEYRRIEELVWRGQVKWPEELRYLPGEAYLVRRAQLLPGPGGRYRKGMTNKAVPPAPYEHPDYIDVYTTDFVWAATVRAGGAATHISDQAQASLVLYMPTYDLLWPITPMRRQLKTFQYRDLSIEVRPEIVDLGAPLGRLASLLVADEFSYRGSRWRREAWYAPQFPVPVKRAWHFPRRSEYVELTLELMAFEPGPTTPPREVRCLAPVSVNMPSLGYFMARAGLTRERPTRPPRDSTDRFSSADSIIGYVVLEPLGQIPVGATITPRARWFREDIEIYRWSPRAVSVDPTWQWFWWRSSLPREQARPGSYALEWSLDGIVLFRIPFAISEP